MRAIFLADAHLRHPQDRNYQQLLKFLEQQQDLDGLFLLGDIFEIWLGYKHLAFSSYIPLLERLRQLVENGTRLFFVEGNHDFNLGPYFRDILRCTIIPDEQRVDWDGKKLFLCHGDLLNPNRKYQLLRSFWRSGLIRVLSRLVHPDLVWSFAIWASDKSQQNHPEDNQWDPTPLILPFARKQFAEGCDAVLCGHFHRAVNQENDGKRLIVVGDWINQFSYAELIDGRFEMKNFAG